MELFRQKSFRKINRLIVVYIFAMFFSSAGGAQSNKFHYARHNKAPDMDGPGSFGELQDTVTLSKLTYLGSSFKSGSEEVFLRNDKGKIFRLKLGTFVGENTGIIVKIDDATIYVQQVVEQNGEWNLQIVEFPKFK